MTAQDALARPFTPKLTVDDYLLLDRSGAFDAYAKTELIDGAVVAVNAQFSEHFTVKTKVLLALAEACKRLGSGLQAWSEGSITMPPHSVPEPDVFVTTVEPVRGPVALETVALIVEVASTSLSDDLGVMLRIYAQAGVPEYWVADVKARVIHQMWAPSGGAYAERRVVAFGDRVQSGTIDGLGVDTAAL
ncbi:Uma2 family endonuclease [Sphingomonas sp. CARO-RG-8B-R24-01]|uniref:Uma2 family endonuclease n=1 Tax=Sphingomonas sp. CARO-RG-8B-R24-01 TaxID=2914831 RepID=UPI001F55C63E|nr:Uma2 family endonuclease [Sphingomonas sp. CARO-RG-8B-R24-01]